MSGIKAWQVEWLTDFFGFKEEMYSAHLEWDMNELPMNLKSWVQSHLQCIDNESVCTDDWILEKQ